MKAKCMSDFYQKTETERRAADNWRDNSKDNFEKVLNEITIHQERKLLNSQVILFVFIGALLVSLLAGGLFDLLTNIALTSLRIFLDIVIIGFTSVNSYFVYILFQDQVKKYTPAKPMLRFIVELENTSAFLQKGVYERITEYLKQGNLTDYKTFAEGFFDSLVTWFPYMFGDKVSKVPIDENEQIRNDLLKEYPILSKVYDLSQLSPTGVKFSVEVMLSPDVIFCIGNEGKTAAYGFKVIFFFTIENPDHCDAGKFLQRYYLTSSNDVVKFSSHAIAAAFRKIGVPSGIGAYIEAQE
jgi:hypothetical protein